MEVNVLKETNTQTLNYSYD